MTIKEQIQKDLEAGKFYQICSNETTFKEYVFRALDKQMQEVLKCLPEDEKIIGSPENIFTASGAFSSGRISYKLEFKDNLKKAKLI